MPAAPLPTSLPISTPTSLPLRLTICLGKEPKSLFYYDAGSAAAQSVLSALYDGPFDTLNFKNQAVILENVPSLASGDVFFEPIEVTPGDLLVDAYGSLAVLKEGVLYRPAGCHQHQCAQNYSGGQPVQMDQWGIRFRLRPGLLWSDGQPLTADDSLYSYELATGLQPQAWRNLLDRTVSYHSLDAQTVEWRGLPGYQDGDYPVKFFWPLPRHLWSGLPLEELAGAEIATRKPAGWGAYQVQEWLPGERILLQKNPFYFRASQGLPHFDNLIFRFFPDSSSAVEALLAGQCDVLDPSAISETQFEHLKTLQEAGRISVSVWPARSWEQITLGIASLDENRPAWLAQSAVRQAVAACLDRQSIAASVLAGWAQPATGIWPPGWPGLADDTGLGFDPSTGQALLEGAGWLDIDGNPATPRTALAVPGVADGTPLILEYLTSTEAERRLVAQQVQASLAACGIGLQPVYQQPAEYLAAGPDGAVFGRRFDLAQFAWPATGGKLCGLFLSREISASPSEAVKGWGGANAGGYDSALYDQACLDGLAALPDDAQRSQAMKQVQSAFVSDAPAVPLYWRPKLLAARPDLCGIALDASVQIPLWNLEVLDIGEACP